MVDEDSDEDLAVERAAECKMNSIAVRLKFRVPLASNDVTIMIHIALAHFTLASMRVGTLRRDASATEIREGGLDLLGDAVSSTVRGQEMVIESCKVSHDARPYIAVGSFEAAEAQTRMEDKTWEGPARHVKEAGFRHVLQFEEAAPEGEHFCDLGEEKQV